MNENGAPTLEKELEIKTVVETVKKIKKAPVKIEGGFAILNDYFRLAEGTYRILKRNVNRGVNTLLLGPTGLGKSELAYNMALTEGLPCTMFDMGTMTDPIMSLVGTHAIKVKGGITESKFIKSRFSEVIQRPGVVILDEISRASAQANNLLFPVLDFRKELSMEYSFDNFKPIKAHPQCVFLATANMGSQYTGTHKLDRALIDRFMMIEMDSLETQQIKDIISYHYKKVPLGKRDKIVDVYEKINAAYVRCDISFNLSIRHLKMVSELVTDKFTIYDSFYTICKGIGSQEGLKSLQSLLDSVKTAG